jgi:predicted transcriptional regulator
MPKATDVTGTIRIPEEGYGRFWNFMRSMPGAEFTPVLEAKGQPAKRTHGKVKEGTTGKCLMLEALQENAMKAAEANQVLVAAGKSPKSVGNVLFELKKAKLITQKDGWYAITAKGKKFRAENCKAK